MKPMLFNTEMVRAILEGRKTVTRRVVKPQPPATAHVAKIRYSWSWSWWEDSDSHEMKSPYRPGDILYVRETWTRDGDVYRYKAGFYDQNRKWRPSIHMPREAARIFLRVTDVRVERLQDITGDDLVRDFGLCPDAIKAVGRDALAGPVWDSTIKSTDRALYGWEANPWVWVIEFERYKKSEGGLTWITKS